MVRLKCDDTFRDNAGVPEGIRTVTTACGKQHSISYYLFNDLLLSPLAEGPVFPLSVIRARIQMFQKQSDLFLATGGVHSCALCDMENLICFMEDIGRHNAFDKVLGFALTGGVDLTRTFLLTSGRVPSDMMTKAVRARIPVIISHSAPTDSAIDMALKYNVTLSGFARGTRMNVYSAVHRVGLGNLCH
jgi:FdhD protein